VAQVVGAHLPLEALRRELQRPAHHAGVADEAGQPGVLVEQQLGEGVDRVEVGQVQLEDHGVPRPGHRRACLLALGHVADGQHHGGAPSDEIGSRGQADAAVGSGDDERAAGLLGELPRVPGHGRQA
jgi:hypothetical protein